MTGAQMLDKPINPWLRQALELGPPILFFIAYMRFQDTSLTIAGRDYDGFILVTAGFVPLLLATIALLWKLTGRISRIQVFTALMVIVFGGLTVWLNDERFFKMKTTLVYGFFAVTLGIGLIRGQGWLKVLMGEMLPMSDRGWLILSRRIAAVFALMAVANEIAWRTQTTEFWVTFETFVLPAFLFLGFMAQSKLIERESLSAGGEGSDPDPKA
jgi:intracellular septation protein